MIESPINLSVNQQQKADQRPTLFSQSQNSNIQLIQKSAEKYMG